MGVIRVTHTPTPTTPERAVSPIAMPTLCPNSPPSASSIERYAYQRFSPVCFPRVYPCRDWRTHLHNLPACSSFYSSVPPHYSQCLYPQKETSDLTSKEKLNYLSQWTHLEFFRDMTKLGLTYMSSFSDVQTTHLDPRFDHHSSYKINLF